MTLEEQGAYRNLLDEAHLRGGPLPIDERILAKACGDALAWPRVREAVLARFPVMPDGYRHNETMDEVYARTLELSEERSRLGKLGAASRWGSKSPAKMANMANTMAATIANGMAKPIANGMANGMPSVSVSVSVSGSETERDQEHRAQADDLKETTDYPPLPRDVRAVKTPTIFDGSLARDHLRHEACDATLARCVPRPVHEKLLNALSPRFQGDRLKAAAELLRWYVTVWATLPAEFVMPDAFRFWQGRFDGTYATPDPRPSRRLTEDAASMDAGVLAILRKKGALS